MTNEGRASAADPRIKEAAGAVYRAIHGAIAASEKTREPMNALVLWTELGKGLSGKLEQQGADVGLLGRLIARDCAHPGAEPPIPLDRWAYRVDPAMRLSREEIARAFTRVRRAIGDGLADIWGDGDGAAHAREDFLATVRGWFAVGLDVFRCLPAAEGRTEAEIEAALSAWCDRYLPKDTSGPEELGVRKEKGPPRRGEEGPRSSMDACQMEER